MEIKIFDTKGKETRKETVLDTKKKPSENLINIINNVSNAIATITIGGPSTSIGNNTTIIINAITYTALGGGAGAGGAGGA
ncbi:MAG: hypothetical protein NT039_00630, partial [Candidatus Berkelbacteria bacterium]|nr:hypothetical protein [Candidatus Berkelbacteria bacterium]